VPSSDPTSPVPGRPTGGAGPTGADPGALPGGFDLQGLLAQAQQVQQQLTQAQDELAAIRVDGTSGGGLVTATVSGTGELLDLAISPDAIDRADDAADTAETLAALVLAAVRAAVASSRDVAEQALGPFAGGLGGGGLPGFPGGPGG
jgi:DNA-binding YbaB/EbfC family protein